MSKSVCWTARRDSDRWDEEFSRDAAEIREQSPGGGVLILFRPSAWWVRPSPESLRQGWTVRRETPTARLQCQTQRVSGAVVSTHGVLGIDQSVALQNTLNSFQMR